MLVRQSKNTFIRFIGENTQDYMLEATQRKPRLNAIQFELTSRCNERCIHCYIPNAKKNAGGDMPIEKVVDEDGEWFVSANAGINQRVALLNNVFRRLEMDRSFQRTLLFETPADKGNSKRWETLVKKFDLTRKICL